MSRTAPWFALSSDWSDSEMFDDSSMGVRLAWVELLAWTKAHGRAGRVQLRSKAFAKKMRLAEDAVDEMLDRASSGLRPAIIRQGDEIVIVNWKRYQDPKARVGNDLATQESVESRSNGNRFSKTPKFAENDATNHQAPITKHRNQSQKNSCGEASQAMRSPPTSPAELSEFEFATRGKALTHRLTRSEVEGYLKAFPGLDVDSELRKAVSWCASNASNRKTPDGIPRFVFSWLSRAANSQPSQARAQRQTVPNIDPCIFEGLGVES